LRRKKQQKQTFQAICQKLKDMGFELVPDSNGRLFVCKYGCAAGITAGPDGALSLFVRPGRVIRGELARLIDRGYQKFLKTADLEVPALAEDLRSLQQFVQELKYAVGSPTLYNEALGAVSDRYLYDRVWYRDQGSQPKPWEQTPK
jgi:hypothetical protein